MCILKLIYYYILNVVYYNDFKINLNYYYVFFRIFKF